MPVKETNLASAAAVLFFSFELGVDFATSLFDQEESASQQDQVSPGKAMISNVENRLFQPDYPAD